MKYNIKYSQESLSDLDEIYDYIFSKLKNQIAARNTVNGILNSIQNLASFLNSATAFSLPTGEETIYKFIVCKNYLIFFHLQNNDVYIDRVLHGKRDYIKILFPTA